MIVGEVLYPDESHPRKKVECDSCGISYTNSQYKNLLDIYKILYFNTFSTEVEYSYSILCHDCFLNNLKSVSKEMELDEEGLPFFILTENQEIQLAFHKEEDMPEHAKEEAEDGYAEDFIKDIMDFS